MPIHIAHGVTATPSDDSAAPATRVVWPSLIEGLASVIGVGYSLDTPSSPRES